MTIGLPSSTPMFPNSLLTSSGVLPIRESPVRFAVGSPDGLTSNSWRVWVSNKNVYIACRDNMKEAKVSLHASGKWRMGFTTEAVKQGKVTLPPEQDRAWEVWDEPDPPSTGAKPAFRLLFPTTELAITPELRQGKRWKTTVFIEAGPPGKMTVLTLFITDNDTDVVHESEPSFRLASLEIEDGRFAQLIAHAEPEGDISTVIGQAVSVARHQAEEAGISIPEGAYSYFLGRLEDGSRYLVGAKLERDS